MFENMAQQLIDQGGPELYWAVMDELKNGIELQRMRVQSEVLSWSETPTKTSTGVDGIGFCEMDVPTEIYFNWQQYETGFWGDAASRRWFLNKNPQFRVKYQPKAQTGWKPTLDRTAGGLWIGSKYGSAN